jgi:hypothetical protein
LPLIATCIAGAAVIAASEANAASLNTLLEQQGPAVALVTALDEEGKVKHLGTGFFVDSEGTMITALHVLTDSHAIRVRTIDGKSHENAEIVQYDIRKDIALLKLEGSFAPVTLGDSNAVSVGEVTVSVGNPEGFVNSISTGIVSAVRNSKRGHKLFQITTPISAGSSGAPLFNEASEVIGVIQGYWSSGENINFAIPINYVRALIGTRKPVSLEELNDRFYDHPIYDEEEITKKKRTILENVKVTSFETSSTTSLLVDNEFINRTLNLLDDAIDLEVVQITVESPVYDDNVSLDPFEQAEQLRFLQRLTFTLGEIFDVSEAFEDAFIPVTVTLMNFMPEASLTGLDLYDPKGNRIGKIDGVERYKKIYWFGKYWYNYVVYEDFKTGKKQKISGTETRKILATKIKYKYLKWKDIKDRLAYARFIKLKEDHEKALKTQLEEFHRTSE